MDTVQISQVGVLMNAPSFITDPIPTGGNHKQRTFKTEAGSVTSEAPTAEPVVEDDATPEQAAAMQEIRDIVGDDPERAVHAAEGCDRLGRMCVQHENDFGDLIHRGARHTVPAGPFGKHLLEHQLVQWSDDSKPVLGFAGDLDWSELGLPDVDALIAAVEKQLVGLRDCRAALAAALGAPPTEPPKNHKAQPADAGEQVQA